MVCIDTNGVRENSKNRESAEHSSVQLAKVKV